jgi:hypothetical protein
MRLLLAVIALLVLIPRPAAAEVSLQLQNGRVTLLARQAPIQQVLGEWARKGRTRIVNLERVAGPPLTLELKDVPEQKALAILLRSVAGYIAAPRPVAMAGASVYDRILILPTSTAPMAAPAAPRPQIAVAPPPMLPDPTELANGEGEDPNATDEQTPDPQPRQPPVFIPPTAQPGTQEQDESEAQSETPANPGILPNPGITPGTAPGQFTTPTPGVLPPPPPPAPQPRQ